MFTALGVVVARVGVVYVSVVCSAVHALSSPMLPLPLSSLFLLALLMRPLLIHISFYVLVVSVLVSVVCVLSSRHPLG